MSSFSNAMPIMPGGCYRPQPQMMHCPPRPMCPPQQQVHQQQFNYSLPQQQPAINIHNNIQPPMMMPSQPPVTINIQPPVCPPPVYPPVQPPFFGGIPFSGQFNGQLGGGIPFGGQFNGQLGSQFGQGFNSSQIGGLGSDFTQQGNNFNLPPAPPPMPPKKKSALPWILGGGALALLLLANNNKAKTTETGGEAAHEGGDAEG